MKKNSGIGKFVAGALVGAGLGVLFAPKSGKETRADIKKKLDEIVEQAKALKAEDVKEMILKKVDELQEELKTLDKEKVLKIAKQKAKKIQKKAEDLYKLAVAKGTPVLEKTTKELKEATANALQKIVDKLEEKYYSQLVAHKVCTVTIATVVNPELAKEVNGLTKQQLIDIFTGKIKNWKEVGGPDLEILLIARPQTSGTRAVFREYALDGNEEMSGAALETDDSGTLLQTVADNKGAIGYVALPYIIHNNKVSALAIDGVEPTLENTYNGSYPVWGYEYMYTKGEPKGVIKAYLDYIVSDEYGVRIEEQGYGVTAKMTVER